MQTKFDEHHDISANLNKILFKRDIARYFGTSIVSVTSEISFRPYDISFLLSEISLLVSEKSFGLNKISSPLSEISLQISDISLALMKHCGHSTKSS